MPSSDNAFPPRSKTFSYSSANKTRIILCCVTRGDCAFLPALRLKRTAISTPAAASAFATASRSPVLPLLWT
ncbi:hypothetical protein L249_7638 [Ophiocordyceps polyrhachis-furcata BCC 54312]|uniref:Uncharacterized protein n=1 Tax=Ophiocordyceps polyrhachis-furcata BCC 54312 TaxID=1330021 RepID=A0A367LB65_9HYPO|nr:hypothetical protein L249_7638 [Ophiocordyceps polyrhachis-furcata BCC 54312]